MRGRARRVQRGTTGFSTWRTLVTCRRCLGDPRLFGQGNWGTAEQGLDRGGERFDRKGESERLKAWQQGGGRHVAEQAHMDTSTTWT